MENGGGGWWRMEEVVGGEWRRWLVVNGGGGWWRMEEVVGGEWRRFDCMVKIAQFLPIINYDMTKLLKA